MDNDRSPARGSSTAGLCNQDIVKWPPRGVHASIINYDMYILLFNWQQPRLGTVSGL